MTQKIIAIYTDDTRPGKFVASWSRRDGAIESYSVLLTANPDEAYDFGTKDAAREFIPKINNPYERTYRERVLVVNKRRKKQLEKSDLK